MTISLVTQHFQEYMCFSALVCENVQLVHSYVCAEAIHLNEAFKLIITALFDEYKM